MPVRIVLAFLACLLAGLLAFFLVRQETGTLRRSVDAPVLVKQIQALNELVTVRYSVQKVVGLEEQKFPVGSERILLIVQARVLGGVDLSGMQAARIKIQNFDHAVISLPPARIIEVAIDEKQTKVWDRSVTWWTPWVPYNPDLERQARLAALKSVEDSAREMGILDHARQNAERSIRTLLAPLGITNVVFDNLS
ncbi:MAG: DUF4230 domain-containing protein [Bryobacter sp.]|jgi:hypothetical protein|nr:DUF4230 domain-containing protein [Bryobacter sp.]